MSEKLPERADIRQLRIQAKELLRELQSGKVEFDQIPPDKVKLADAQRAIARKYGFSSWPNLVESLETPMLLDKLRAAIMAVNVEEVEHLLRTKPVLRKHLDQPMFEFDAPPILHVSMHERATPLIPLLIRYSADPNARSKWWAGGFSALDFARGKAVDALLAGGAEFDVWSASRHGRLDVLQKLLSEDPGQVNARGGDGQTPLHFASTVEVAQLLVDHGADLEIKDIDHESTPAQHQILNREVLRLLLELGAKPDVMMAAVLDDVDLLKRLCESTPEMLWAHVGAPPFVCAESNGGHIYNYLLGGGKSVAQVAAEHQSHLVTDFIFQSSDLAQQFLLSAWNGDEATVRAIKANTPDIIERLGDRARVITDAAQAGRAKTVELLLEAGLDPNAPGMDGGTALHLACWYGHLDVVRLLVNRVSLLVVDPVHQSPPLGWAAHGSRWCNNPSGDYPGVVRLLLESGADPNAPANLHGVSMIDQAQGREDVIEVLRSFGAK